VPIHARGADSAIGGRSVERVIRTDQEELVMDPDRLREVVAAIPHGAWMSYGDVALAAGGSDRHARALNRRMMRDEVAGAHRVLRFDGSVGATALGDPAEVRRRLESEGVEFIDGRADPTTRLRLPRAAPTSPVPLGEAAAEAGERLLEAA
jgi:alkylated DNA nucleotide flippase Atl1